MTPDSVAGVASCGLVTRHEPVDLLAASTLLFDEPVPVPADHIRLLGLTNGAEAFGGYIRLYGLAPRHGIDLRHWNRPDGWRQAWRGRLDGFWCFGGTAWGDQYAYREGEPGVFRLDAYRMEAEPVAASFAAFLGCEFLRQAERPHDDLTVQARQRVGDLEARQMLLPLPSPLGGPGIDTGELAVLPAEAVMTENGFRLSAFEARLGTRPTATPFAL